LVQSYYSRPSVIPVSSCATCSAAWGSMPRRKTLLPAAGRKQIDSAIVDPVLADLEVDPLKTKNVVTQQETLTPQRTPIILDPGLFEGSSRATWTASKPTPKTPRRLRSSLTPLLQACCHKSRSLLCRRRRRNLIQASREVSCRGERRLCRLSWTIWSPTLA